MNGYYCYIKDGAPVIVKVEKGDKSEDFENLPFYKFEMAPNPTVAGMIYEADLKLMQSQMEK